MALTSLPPVDVRPERVDAPDATWPADADAVAVLIEQGGVVPQDLAVRYGVDLAVAAADARVDGGAGSTGVVRLPQPLPGADAVPWSGLPSVLVLAGLGAGTPADARRAGLAVGRGAAGLGTLAVPVAPGTPPDLVRALVEGVLLATYRMPRTGRTSPDTPPVRRVLLLTTEDVAGPVSAARAGVRATHLTRTLAATPSSVKTPQWVADRVVELAADAPVRGGRLLPTVRDERWLAEEGMGGLLAVGAASRTEPRLVTLAWEPETPTGPRVALVGKGITFDTGGLSLKPRDAMIPMKTDIAGAATVLAAVLAAAELGLPTRVTAVLPLAENAVGGRAYRPGDVVRVWDGTTVEISNTDAEGRMVLADALAWAAATLEPDVLVDVATLTGAATMGLGRHHAALYATDDDLAAGLLAAGESSGERAWRMPLVEDYRPALDSDVADVAHAVRDPHVSGGSITAALFLQRFTGARRWGHLDIAGAGRTGSKQPELPANAPTGFGARLLLEYLTAPA